MLIFTNMNHEIQKENSLTQARMYALSVPKLKTENQALVKTQTKPYLLLLHHSLKYLSFNCIYIYIFL